MYLKPSRQYVNSCQWKARGISTRKTDDGLSSKRRAAVTCNPGIKAQRLKRVLNINIPICEAYSGALNTIASIEDPVVIKRILATLKRKAESRELNPLPESSEPRVYRSRKPMMRFSVSPFEITGSHTPISVTECARCKNETAHRSYSLCPWLLCMITYTV